MEQKCSPLMRVTTINEISSVLDKSTKFLEELNRCFGWDEKDFLTDEVKIKNTLITKVEEQKLDQLTL